MESVEGEVIICGNAIYLLFTSYHWKRVTGIVCVGPRADHTARAYPVSVELSDWEYSTPSWMGC